MKMNFCFVLVAIFISMGITMFAKSQAIQSCKGDIECIREV